MPCKIEIKKNITEEIENLSEEAMGMSLKDANEVANQINSDFGVDVISFKQDKQGGIKRTIKIPASLVQEYYDNEMELEKEEAGTVRPPAVVLPIGISGSGKSTWIKSLPEGEYTIVSPDEIRKELTGSISDQTRNPEVFQLVDKKINEAVSNGEQVILDATNLNTKLRRQFIDSLRKNFPEVDIFYKLFPADPVISKERIKKDLDNQVDRSAVPDDVIDRQVVMYTQAIQDIEDEDMIPFAEDVEQDDPFYYTRTEEQLALPKSEETIKFISTLATLKKVVGKKTVRLVSKETGESVSYDVITKKKSKIDPTPVYVLSELEKNKSGKIDPKDSKFKNAGVYAYLDFFMTNQDKELAIDNVISGKGLAVLNKLVDIGLVTATNARVESMIKAPGQQDNIYFYTSAPFEYNLNFLDDLALENSKAKIKEGVQEVFDSNPELASIGTPEQYSAYLDSIFPDSKILYHATAGDVFEDFDINKTYKSSSDLGEGFYLSDKKNIDVWKSYAERSISRQKDFYLEKFYKDIADQLGKRYPLDKLDPSQDILPTMPSLHTFILYDLYPGVASGSLINATTKKDRDVVETVFEELKKMRESGKEVPESKSNKLILSALINKKLISKPKVKEPTYKINTIPVLTNFSKPKVKSSYEEYWENKNLETESIVFEGDENDIYQMVFKNPQQDTRILGGQKDVEGFKKFVKQSEAKEAEAVTSTISDAEKNSMLQKMVENFLEKIGVKIQAVDVLRDSAGNVLDGAAKANMLNGIIQVIEGKRTIDTLPEEAAHFFVEMIGEGHPLYIQMYNKITEYQVYQSTFEKYKDKPAYRNLDGTVNTDKIKKEAMGKLIAKHIIEMDPGAETEKKLVSAINWWQKLWDYITSIFQTTENPFEEAAAMILLGETEQLSSENIQEDEYYQLVDPLQGVLNDQGKITLDNTVDPRTGQKRHIYYYEGKQARGSVTSVYVDGWLKKIFKTDRRSNVQKLIDLSKAEFGDIVHEQIQDIIKSWTNPDGTMKSTQSPIAPKANPTIYKLLNDYVQSVMRQYGEGTRFYSEVKIFDKKTNIAGSIDLLIVQPDGFVDIYDWKTQEIFKDQTDLKSYKEPMYRIQLENYRKILELQYGFTKFGKIRAIPMATSFNYVGGMPSGVSSLEIGDLDPTKIPEEKNYLLPVTLRTELSGDNQLDILVRKLYGVYDKIQKKRYSEEEYFKKREELDQLRTAIRDVQLRNKIDKLVELGLVEFKKYTDKLNNNTLTGKEIPDALNILRVFSSTDTTFYDIRQEVLNNIDKEDTEALEEFKKVDDKLRYMTSRVSKLITDIEEYRNKLAEGLAEKNGIVGLLKAEKKVGTLSGLFTSLSNISQRSFRLFSSLLRRAQGIRDAKFDKATAEMKELKAKFVAWASTKGGAEKGMEMLLDIDAKGNWSGNFLRKYKPEFKKERNKAIDESDTEWLVNNQIFDEDETYENEEKRQREYFESIVYASDEVENLKIIEEKMKDWITNHRVVMPDGRINIKALYNKNNRFLKAKEQWYTDKWKALNKPENKPLKDVYDYFQNLLKQSKRLGMFDKYSPHFIPSLAKDKMDQLVFGDVKGLFSTAGFFEDLEVDSGTTYTPEIDPTTGEIINRIPVYFTKDMGVKREDGTVDYSKKSRDLFKVFATWAAHMYNYEAMSSIEDDALNLIEVEANKKSLVTDNFGNIVIENGQVKAADKNDRNAKLLEDFVNFYLYNRVTGMGSDTAVKIRGKEYSLLKTASALMRFFSLKTLALNPVSGTANFVGGKGNALFMAEKGIFFTKKSWAQAMGLVAGNKKAQAALVYLNILQEGNKNQLINELSISNTERIVNTDNAFILQRLSDKAVQYPVAIAMMMNHMVENGEIVDIQQWVKNKYNYNTTFYNLSQSEQKSVRAKIDAEVKELQEKRSLLAIGKLDDNTKEFEIPGIEKTSDTFIKFRSKIMGVSKKILGNNTREDINGIRTTLWGQAVMQFRNWMPEMVEERFAGLKYDDELQTWTYGKMNLFFSELFSKRGPMLLKSIIKGLGTNAVDAAKESYEARKREAIEKGEDFTITEGEYIDLYIANIRSEIKELMILLGLGALVFAVVSSGAGDDDDESKGMKKYLSRALRKYYSEFAFYYNPRELTKIVNQPVPMVGLAEDLYYFFKNITKEVIGQGIGSEEWTKEAKPAKYFFRMVPIAKEFMLIQAAYDDDFRKEWDIRIDAGFR